MSELSSQAYEAACGEPNPPARGVFSFPPWARPQIISPETGCELPTAKQDCFAFSIWRMYFPSPAMPTEDMAGRRGGWL